MSESSFLRSRRKELFDLPEQVALQGVGEVPVSRLKRRDTPPVALAG